ncbi:MAG TPA: hypothetical protein VHA35_07770 [Dongiaceae bacterium]|nr:hypothetical protein [Dongiaceae bacterium]
MPAGLRLILAVLLAATIRAGTAAAACTVPDPVKVLVTIDAPPVVYDHTLPRAAIKQREIAFNRRSHSEADVVLGTTETRIQPQARLQIEARPDGAGRFCATVASLSVVIDWKAVVHVASELEGGSCMYNVVMTHEQGHVDIARSLMGKAKDLIGRALSAVARKGATAATPETAYQALQQAGAKALDGAMSKLNAEMERRQQAHDNPEEYARGRKVCGITAYYNALGR